VNPVTALKSIQHFCEYRKEASMTLNRWEFEAGNQEDGLFALSHCFPLPLDRLLLPAWRI
jgi:hypothetical protein